MNHQSYPWTSFGILIGMGSIALFLALPRPIKPVYFVISVSILGVLIGTGLYLSKNIGINPLFINRFSLGGNMQKILLVLGHAALVGIGLGTVILGVIRFVLLSILPNIQQRFTNEANVAVWKRVVIAFDSSVLEEIIFRLFLFSLLIWIGGKIWQMQRPPTSQILWIINILIAIGFGIAHLPQWATFTPLTLPIILIVVFLNSIGGLTFGYLYFENGLESAMIAHFFADLVLHVIGTGFLQI